MSGKQISLLDNVFAGGVHGANFPSSIIYTSYRPTEYTDVATVSLLLLQIILMSKFEVLLVAHSV